MTAWSAQKDLRLPQWEEINESFYEPLDLPTPEDFLTQLGCETVTQFVGFYFSETDGYAVYDNGVSEQEVDATIWECWKAQRHVAPIFSEIDALWKQHEKFYGLIFDVETLSFFRAEVSAISDFLYQHYLRTNDLTDL